MNGSSDVSIGQKTVEGGIFPDSLTTGKTVLIATAGNPSLSFADLHVLCQHAIICIGRLHGTRLDLAYEHTL